MNIEKNSNMMHYRIYTEISLIIKKMSYAKNLNGSKNRLLYIFLPLYLGAKCFHDIQPMKCVLNLILQ